MIEIYFDETFLNNTHRHKSPADRVSAAKIFPLSLLLSGYLSEP
jgi:hypothetical protein